ncbi:MAG: alpha/beta fold hydrolase [Chloroflexi bacterium]|nr:alpha/beta fold hydrolase [Chloroflexota bacterium]
MAALPGLLTAGVPLQEAQAAMILVHGRGATAASILMLAEELDRDGFAYLAPQAPGQTWYPYSFLAPLEQNQPHLDAALATLENVLAQVAAAGVPAERIIFLGFSQGACLASEFVARHARRYGGLVALSGGLIGPPGTPRVYPGDLAGTPVFLGCSDVDPHIPAWRVEESAAVLEQLGAAVTMRLYPGMGHSVNEDEINFVRQMMETLTDER